MLVHRLVASTFLENLMDTNMTVNHIDGNRLNNKIDNLEWLSLKDNIRDGHKKGFYTCQKSVIVVNKETKEVKKIISQSEASRYMNKKSGYINNCNFKNKFENDKYKWRVE